MKLSYKLRLIPDFEPRSLVIEFESQAEMEAIYAVFDVSPICNFLETKGIETAEIRENIYKLGADRIRSQENFHALVKVLEDAYKRKE